MYIVFIIFNGIVVSSDMIIYIGLISSIFSLILFGNSFTVDFV